MMELDVAWLEEMCFDGDVALNLSFSDYPFGDPLSCGIIAELYIFASNSDINVESILSELHENWIVQWIPLEAQGSL